MRTIHHSGRRLRVFRRFEGAEAAEALRFADPASALAFLRSAMADTTNMRVFRRVLHIETDGHSAHRLDDHQVLDHLSWLVISGRIVLSLEVSRPEPEQTAVRRVAGGAGAQVRRGLDNGPAEAPRRQVETRAPPPPPVRRAPAVPAPVVDVAEQVATLLAAARDGTPFCEQCARAAAESSR